MATEKKLIKEKGIRERSPGVFEVYFYAPTPAGGKKLTSVTVKGTITDARKMRRNKLVQVEQGGYIDSGKMTLKIFLEKWMKDYCEVNLARSTVDSYKIIVEKHLIPGLGHHVLSKLTPLHVQEYYSKALKGGRVSNGGPLSPKTVHSHHRILHRALKTAVKWQLVIRNVCDSVEPPKLEQYEGSVYDEKGSANLLKVAEGTRLYVPVLLALATGMRRGELLGARWQDLDLDAMTITTNQTLLATSGGLQFKTPKTKKSRRTITLPATVVDELKKHKVRQEAERLSRGDAWDKSNDLIIRREDGSPWHPGTFSHNYKDLLDDNGLPSIRFHDLRHTHASLLLRQGVHPKIVSERLGHSQIGITLDIYSHVLPGIQEEVAAKLDDKLFKKKQG